MYIFSLKLININEFVIFAQIAVSRIEGTQCYKWTQLLDVVSMDEPHCREVCTCDKHLTFHSFVNIPNKEF